MGGIVLEWAQFGDFDSFDVMRADAPMDVNNLPPPIVTGLTTMYFVDTSIEDDILYRYRVRAWRGASSTVSDEINVSSTLNFDEYVSALAPITWLKLDESSTGAITDSGSLGQSCVTDGSFHLPRGKVLRKGHAGAMGFAINSPGVSRINVTKHSAMTHLTKGSFTWFAWVHRTIDTSFNFLFADFISASSGTANMRAYSNAFQFPDNDRQIYLPSQTGETLFIAVIYDATHGLYKAFSNGVWTSAAYAPPPTTVANTSILEVPGYGSWGYYGMRGYISDLAFFDRALTVEEIETCYAVGVL